ncbi:MAG: DMT family transporter [Alphaproteobacteria bacterium]|nr:DMT family transporter [Alphaproteobacteria bacterium]
MTTRPRAQHRLGLALVALAAIAWSSAGYFTRLIQVDAWTILVWRGLFGGTFIAAFMAWHYGRDAWPMVRDMGWPGWMVTLASTAAMSSFIPALKLTSIANVAIIYATCPFVAALLARLWFGERVPRHVVLLSAAAFAGVAIAMAGPATEGSRVGDAVAVFMTLATAVMMVALRRYRDVPMVPAASLSNLLGVALALPFAAPLEVSGVALVQLAAFGFFQMTLGLTLFTIGARHITAAEAALVATLESPLTPFWVWLAFGEVPSLPAMFGGGVVLAAVVANVWLSSSPAARAAELS